MVDTFSSGDHVRHFADPATFMNAGLLVLHHFLTELSEMLIYKNAGLHHDFE